MEICKVLVHKELCSLDVDDVLQKMDALEKRGGYFIKILDDYKKVSKIEGKKKFQFVPDLFIESPEEFTRELFRYANENNLNLVITKESMYPVFEIDGVEYTAHRYVQRYGARVECTATHPELLDDQEIPEGRRKKLRLFYWSIGPLVIILTTLLLLLERGFTTGAVIAGISQAIISIAFLRYYYNLR